MPTPKTFSINPLTKKELEAVTFAIDQVLIAIESEDAAFNDRQLKQQYKHLRQAYTKFILPAINAYVS